MIYSNYHTHTRYCDGKDTPEEIVLEAIRLGCKEIGFSGHAYTSFDPSYCMSADNMLRYRNEILSLKEKYKGSINVLLGYESDLYSDPISEPYDFLIGGVHYIKKNGVYIDVDASKQDFIRDVGRYYDGDYLAFCEDYYANVSQLYEKTGCNIIAHFDLVTKFNENDVLFDTSKKRYVAAAENALQSLKDLPVKLEINTGAMARGYRTEPYPSAFILEKAKMLGIPLILGSDCHDKTKLLFGFDRYAHLLRSV